MSNNELAKQLLSEYGEAIRGDWSDLDGRDVRSALDDISELIDSDEKFEIEVLREELNLCPKGNGHWTDFCDGSCV